MSTTQRKRTPTIQILRPKSPAILKNFIYGFSTRIGGFSSAYGRDSLNLGFTVQDRRSTVLRNRAAFLQAIGAKNRKGTPWPLVTLRQVHSDIIHRVSRAPERPLVGDGLVTNKPGLIVGVLTADCLPIVILDPNRGAVGVFHAGWRGTLQRIVEKGVGELRRSFHSLPGDLRAIIGPGIGKCCYQVGNEVRTKFESQFSYATELFHEIKDSDPVRERYPLLFLTARPPGHSELPVQLFLDLVEANRRQLLAAGISAKNIQTLNLCTSCNTDRLFSHRKESGCTGRMLGVAGIRP